MFNYYFKINIQKESEIFKSLSIKKKCINYTVFTVVIEISTNNYVPFPFLRQLYNVDEVIKKK